MCTAPSDPAAPGCDKYDLNRVETEVLASRLGRAFPTYVSFGSVDAQLASRLATADAQNWTTVADLKSRLRPGFCNATNGRLADGLAWDGARVVELARCRNSGPLRGGSRYQTCERLGKGEGG